jgi:glycosyltransferase involved in cell wall biosynthesis
MKKIAALVPNKLGVSPGQRLRIEAWSKYLPDYGWEIEFFPFEDDKLHEVFYTPGNRLKKIGYLAGSYARQASAIVRGLDCDGLFIYREAALVGPAFLERVAGRLKVPMIYDIDDPVFLPYRSPVNGWLSLLKFSRKTHSLFKMSDRVIAINSLIGDYARKFSDSVSVVPNFVDTEVYKPLDKADSNQVKIVWTGSVSTLRNLNTIAEPLRRLQEKYGVIVRTIANGTADIDGVELDQRQWSPQAEVENLQDCDIGIVPLLDDLDWNPWKFYLKTIQYMAVGLPVVARRIGSNSEVIEEGVTGFLVDSEEEWFDRISLLIQNPGMRSKMGRAARQVAVDKYSISAQMPRVAAIFDDVYGGSN